MEIDPAAAWSALEEPWRVCLSLAWEAYGAGAPATLAVAERLLEAGAPELAARRVALPDALEAIWMYLERTEPL
jgi:uncharacterized YccA/Bax inhibitor family protein